MTAYVNITVAQRKDALLVPNSALRFHPVDIVKTGDATRGDESAQEGGGIGGVVYVLKDGQPSAVHVGIGISDNRMSEVLGGNLKPGDKVITSDRQATSANSTNRHMGPF